MASELRRAIVTGGSSGIGFEIAKALVAAGNQVTIIARNEERLRSAAERLGIEASWRRADVGNRRDVEDALVGLQHLDVLVNAAGFAIPVSLSTTADEAEANWDKVISGNLKGSFLMAHAVASLLTSPGGRIINISSIAAQMGGRRSGSLAYAAAKSGLHGLTFALARELAPRGITVNVIAPGFIANTGFTGGWPQERVSGIVSETPLGRPGTPADVAGAVLWLASEAASFVTGSVISVNGGWRFG
jgi:3-oxoacyl-[acyl-carrier protein] reductase